MIIIYNFIYCDVRALTYKTGNRDYRSWDVNTIIFFIIVTMMTKFIFK